ncbi:MAG: hypothetical protein CL477_03690 [Acidobacteria bacterium]|jgi:hypothetical protein|nr:hypothetical protein [Acidobacteriota bacterium]MDP7337962.1 DUF1552 domain-containing protein [Vicinamibacterales bacterium]MDP7479064.1 DUF1552 domain-containing protein [Vicinamibacterales bacterium]HJN46501.1 DUF1552 domain-containing protein [Vicinamibacterales bacterium]
MIITKMALPRRTFLRGLGATLALPLLDAMVPAASALAQTAASPTKRLGFIYIPNGANMLKWTPSTDGALELSPILSPLAPVKEHVVIPTGLAHRQAEAWGDGNGEHSRASGVWLNGVHPKRTEGADVRAGTTADQIAAQALGQGTPLPSLEISIENSYVVGNCDNGYSCVYTNTISWRSPTTPLPMEHNPRVVFERLFGEGGTTTERLARLREDRSILDAVRDDMTRLERKLGAGDRVRVSQYLDAVREIERRIQRVEAQADEAELPENLARPVGIPESFDEHARLMFDLQALAFQADITRVFTYLIGREQTAQSYPEIGVPDAHHATSHHQMDPGKLEQYAKINTYHVDLLAGFLKQLQSTPDGDGSLLDQSLILYGGGISDGDQHSHIDLPLILAGGGAGQLEGRRHVRYPTDTPMTNLLLAMLDKAGVVHAEQFGDATGRLDLEPLNV